MRSLRFRRLYLSLLFAELLLLLWLSLTPQRPQVLAFEWGAKLEHCLAYALVMGWCGQLWAPGTAKLRVALSLIALGGLMEILQHFTATRHGALSDALVNALGVGLGYGLTQGWGGRRLNDFEKN